MAGLAPTEGAGVVGNIIEGTAKDLYTTARYAPSGLYATATGIGADVGEAAQGHPSFRHSRKLVSQMAEQIATDVRHPLRHPGYTAMDAFAALSAGAGAASRVGAAGRLARAGETGAAVKALTRRTPPRETTIGGATRLEPDNPLLRPLHRRRTEKLAEKLDRRGGDTELEIPGFGPEHVIGRERRAVARVEADIASGPAKALARQEKKLSRPERIASRLVAIEGHHALEMPEEVVARHAETHRRWAREGIDPELNMQVARDIEEALPFLRHPSDAFLHHVEDMRHLSRRGEEEAITRGLIAPEQAEARLTEIAGHFGRAGAAAPKGAFYFPTGPQFKIMARRAETVKPYSPRPSEYGLGPPQKGRYAKGSLRRFTGQGLRHGVVEKPAAALADRYAALHRYYGAQDLYDYARLMASDVRHSEKQVPIRDHLTISDDLRKTIDADLEAAAGGDANALARVERTLRAEEHADAPIGTQIEGVKWVDRRVLKQIEAAVPGGLMRGVAAVNKPFRFFGVYLRPAYFLTNYPQNAFMQAIEQGWRVVPNFRKAMTARARYGDALTDQIDAAMGQARTEAFYRPRKGKTKAGELAERAEKAVVGGLTHATDVHARRAAFFYRASEKGYSRADEMRRLIEDPTRRDELVAIVRRARRDAVDFDSMTPGERQLVDLVYFYPWISRATAWTARAAVNRPVKAALANQFAELGQAQQRGILGAVPHWLQGYIATKWGLVNSSPLWTPATPADVADYLGPTARSLIERPLEKPKLPEGSALEQFGTPALQIVAGENPIASLAPVAAAKRAGLVGTPPKTFPETGPMQAAGPYVFGGWYPRAYDAAEIRKQARGEMTPKEREHQDLVRELDILRGLQIPEQQKKQASQSLHVWHANSLLRKSIWKDTQDERERWKRYSLATVNLLYNTDTISKQEHDEYAGWVQAHPEASADLFKKQREWFWRRSKIGEQRGWILKQSGGDSEAKNAAKRLADNRGNRTFVQARDSLVSEYRVSRAKARRLLVAAGWKPDGRRR